MVMIPSVSIGWARIVPVIRTIAHSSVAIEVIIDIDVCAVVNIDIPAITTVIDVGAIAVS